MRLSGELREVLTGAVVAAGLFAASVFLPAFGPLLGFFACAPLIWITHRRGTLAGAFGGLLAVAALLPSIPPPATLFFVIEHALPGWYLGSRLARGRGIIVSSIQAAAFISAALLGLSLLWLGEPGRDPRVLFDEQLQAGLREVGGGFAPGGEASPLAAAEFQAFLALLRRVFPALAVIGLFVECALNSLVVLRLLARRRPPAAPEPVLTAFALPERLIWALIVVSAFVWWPHEEVATVALNLVLPLLFCYLLQGVSVGLHLLQRLHPSRLGLTLVLLALLFQPYLLAIPLLLGLLDFRFDFRTRWAPRPPAAG